MCRVVWEGSTRLFLRRWGGLPEMVVITKHRRPDPPPVPPWEWRKRKEIVRSTYGAENGERYMKTPQVAGVSRV
jgi:hypothetical protein